MLVGVSRSNPSTVFCANDRVLLLLKVEESHCRVLLVDVVVRQLASQRFGPRWPWCDVEEASFRVGVLDLT